MNSRFDHLDRIAREVAHGEENHFLVLSTGEQLYVALAANSTEMLTKLNYTIAEALVRLGGEWTEILITRWRHAGDPRK